MDTGKAKPIRVSLTRIMEDGAGQVEGEPGAPISPLIGAAPDKKTQNIPLMELISMINFRKRSSSTNEKKADSEK